MGNTGSASSAVRNSEDDELAPTVYVRLTRGQSRAVDEHLARMCATLPQGVRVGRSDAIRNLVDLGIAKATARAKGAK
jgi:hypothetical protein